MRCKYYTAPAVSVSIIITFTSIKGFIFYFYYFRLIPIKNRCDDGNFFFKIYFCFIGASWRALFRTDQTIACANGVFRQDYARVSGKFFFFFSIDRCELRFRYNNNAIYNCLYWVGDRAVFPSDKQQLPTPIRERWEQIRD